ncbi:hypothetical protein MCOR25_006759 [Pyricularia grisea]|nr:hypothetical protein MCOR25_006759 [Pyricularia grisea]
MYKTGAALSILLGLAGPVLGVAVAKISQDATCGSASGATCQGSVFGNCCSQYGWCGSSDAYCGGGCQSAFGTCNGATTASGLTVSEDATCGEGVTCIGSGFGDCCSSYGWCGGSEDYCGAGCQSPFGTCNDVSIPSVSAAASGSTQLSLSTMSSSVQAASSSQGSSGTASSSGSSSTSSNAGVTGSASITSTASSSGSSVGSTVVSPTTTGASSTTVTPAFSPAGTSGTSSSAASTGTSGSGTASSTTPASPSSSPAGIRIYQERDLAPGSPACNYIVADKRVQTNIQGEDKREAALAECQSLCDAYPGCRTFFYYEESKSIGDPNLKKIYCAYGVQPWNEEWLQCGDKRYRFSVGYEYVRTDFGVASASASGSASGASSSSSHVASGGSSSSSTSSSTGTTSTTSPSSTLSSTSSTTSTFSSTSPTTTTSSAAPSTTVRTVRVYQRLVYQDKAPGCINTAKQKDEVVIIPGLNASPGPKNDFATGAAQCQGMCDALPKCENFFYSVPATGVAQCYLGLKDWGVDCRQGYVSVFSSGSKLLRTYNVTVTTGSGSTAPSSTVII